MGLINYEFKPYKTTNKQNAPNSQNNCLENIKIFLFLSLFPKICSIITIYIVFISN